MDEKKQPDQTSENVPEKVVAKKNANLKLVILHIISVIVLISGTAAGTYFWRDKVANDSMKKLNNQISLLEKSAATLTKQLNASSATTTTTTATVSNVVPSVTTAVAAISDLAKTNITLSVSTGNTQPLEGYMASTVNVILAATEAYGPQTASQATSDVATFLGTNLSTTWDFGLSEATIASTYGTSGYKQYFPSGALVGKSSDNKVISFVFNENGKISTIFMASAAELMSD